MHVRVLWLAALVGPLLCLGVAAAWGQAKDDLAQLQLQVQQLLDERRYAEALAPQRAVAAALERAEVANLGKPESKTAQALSDLAWFALLAQEFAEALTASERAHSLAPDRLLIETNRAHALLLLDRPDDARAIYFAHRGETLLAPRGDGFVDEMVWEDIIEQDFESLRGGGVNHAAFAEITKGLGIDPSVALKQLFAPQGESIRLFIENRFHEALPVAEQWLLLARQRYSEEGPGGLRAIRLLADVHEALGHYPEAEALYNRALSITEKTFGQESLKVDGLLNHLVKLYQAQGRYAEAESVMKRLLAKYETSRPTLARGWLDALARLHFAQRNWAQAVYYWRRSLATSSYWRTSRAPEWPMGLIKAVYQLAKDDPGEKAAAFGETFVNAQLALGSKAAEALAAMAARGANGNSTLAALVRQGQDLKEEYHKRDDPLDQRDEMAMIARLGEIDRQRARIDEVDKRIADQFPDYEALTEPAPLSVQEVQDQLGGDEALVLLLVTPEEKPIVEETFIWVATRTDIRWVRSHLGSEAFNREVAALRCGLDASLWDHEADATRCRDLLQADPKRDEYGTVPYHGLPFDAARAHALYKALFAQVEDLIRGKHLLIVPSGPLTQLPFQVLVRDGPSGTDHRATLWLARSHAITVLPAVSSLKALRRFARPSAATKPLLGIGNPLLDGDREHRPWEAEWAKLARDKQACRPTLWQRVAGLIQKRRSVKKVNTINGRADLDQLKTQMPLHETADELCAVAKELRISPDDILLGGRATETSLKSMNLAQYRVLHFATHGTVAGEIAGTSEPGLILTPPQQQTELDDGYLSASEIAALKLDADWVILSACNTAAGDAVNAEALSGLARVFMYAGARALLVAHWSVDSAATVKLITSAIGAITRDAKLGRAEAIRRAMLAMIDKGEQNEAHPAYWAPFIVVGEGAAR